MSCDVSSSSSGQDETVGQSKDWWGNKVLIIITGASRGFGRATAIRLAKRFHHFHNISSDQHAPHPAKISFLLLSRVTTGLGQVITEIQETGPAILKVQPVSAHLNESASMTAFDTVLEHEESDYDQVILVHNAGTLSNPDQLVDSYRPSNIAELDEYMRVNLSSAILFTASVLRKYKHCPKRNIINITSLAALQPMKGLALYGSIKAARDQYFKSVALEDHATRVLNYAPGPLRTDMANVLATQGYLKEFFRDRHNLLNPSDSAERMIQILEADNYDNGAHIDYYDPLP